MRLATAVTPHGSRAALVTDTGLIDVASASAAAGASLPSDVLALIAMGDDALTLLEQLENTAPREPLGRLLAPIPDPRRNVFAVGRNYADHVAEGARARGEKQVDLPADPVFFTKPGTAFVGPDDDVELWPEVTPNLDYEAELVVVIGRAGRDISRAEALDHVYGYTIGNDVSARDLQRRHGQWFKGKSLDRTSPIGPWIVPARELDPHDLTVSMRVNGELRQQASTRDLIHDIPTVVSVLSAGMTLLPGDQIMTGTPAGVGHGMTPPSWLSEGDEMAVTISGIGTLTNRVRALGRPS